MSIRAFIAVPLPKGVKEAIHSLGREMVESGLRVRLVRPQGIHCTLRFLGNISESKVEELGEAMAKAVTGVSTTTLEAHGLGVFPNPSKARVIWVGIKGNLEPANHLHKGLQDQLEILGFEKEKRGFSPHLTIGRLKNPLNRTDKELLQRILKAHHQWEGGKFDLKELVLYRSQLHPSGAKYTHLLRVPIMER